MLKRITALTLVIFMLCTGLTAVVAASPNVDINIDYNTNILTVSGTNLGSGGWAVIHIDAPDGQIFYIGSVNVTNGAFTHAITMLRPMDGVYSVRVRAEGVPAPISRNFTYECQGLGDINIDINYITDTVTISGIAGTSNWVTFYVMGPTNRLEFIGSTDVVDGRYEVRFRILNTIPSGEYRLTLKTEGMSTPIHKTFIWGGAYTSFEINNAVAWQDYTIVIRGEQFTGTERFYVSFNPAELEAVNLSALVEGSNTNVGRVHGTDIEIIYFNAAQGIINFKLHRELGENTLNGIINMIQFRARVNGDVTIRLIPLF